MTSFCALYVMLGLAHEKDSSPVRIHIDSGIIEGERDQDGLAVYKGIPYAAPPVGELRWRAPQPVKPWTGVRNVTGLGAWPPQISRNGFYPEMSEDCLYLSVVTPAETPSECLPVMVWIHGGGFQTEWYGTELWKNMAKRGIVMVSIEYRTGALGFMAHPGLSKESKGGHSGNYGLLDQLFALQWVQRNIAKFGGDPLQSHYFRRVGRSYQCEHTLRLSTCQRVVPRSHLSKRGFVLSLYGQADMAYYEPFAERSRTTRGRVSEAPECKITGTNAEDACRNTC